MIPVQREGELDVGAGDSVKSREEMMLVAHGAHRIAVIGGGVNGGAGP
jgi:hypothetical protein